MSLELVPNEFVGFRIQPDFNNFCVVLVRRYGPHSSKAGEEYSKKIAYCRNVSQAAVTLFEYSLRYRGEIAQDEQFRIDQSCANMEVLKDVVKVALQETLVAVAALDAKFDALGLTSLMAAKLLSDADKAGAAASSEEPEEA